MFLPVDHSLIFAQPEYSGPGISVLRLWRYGADFDESESHVPESRDGLAVLVEASSHPHRVGKREPEQVLALKNTRRLIYIYVCENLR